jgi:hypothetical protein
MSLQIAHSAEKLEFSSPKMIRHPYQDAEVG